MATGICDEGFTDHADLGDYADQAGRDDGLVTKLEELLLSSFVIRPSLICVNRSLQFSVSLCGCSKNTPMMNCLPRTAVAGTIRSWFMH